MTELLLVNYATITDIVVIVIIALFAIHGAVKGFTKTFFSVFGTIIALLVAVLLAPVIAKFAEEKFGLVTTLSGSVSGLLTKFAGEDLMNATLGDIGDGLVSQGGVKGLIIKIILDFKSDSTIPMDTPVRDLVCPTVGYYAAMIIVAIILFILLKLIFFIIKKLVKNLYKLKFVAVLDRGLGFVVGVFSGVINIELLLMILPIIPIPFVQQVCTYIDASTVAKFIQNINIYGRVLNAISSINIVDFVKDMISKAPVV